MECKLVQLLIKLIFQCCRKLKNDLPVIPLLSIYPNGVQSHIRTLAQYVQGSFISNRQELETTYMSGQSTEEWIKKEWYIYPMVYYSSVKNNDTMNLLGNECN